MKPEGTLLLQVKLFGELEGEVIVKHVASFVLRILELPFTAKYSMVLTVGTYSYSNAFFVIKPVKPVLDSYGVCEIS